MPAAPPSTVERDRPGPPSGCEPPAHRLRLVLLGRMEVWIPGSISAMPRSRKARGILAVLGLSLGTEVRRSRLAGLLWSRRAEEQQRGSLRQALHELQETLHPSGSHEPPLLVSSRDSLMLVADQVWVDAVEVARARPGRPETLDLMRGELLEDLDRLDPAFDGWLKEQRRTLRAAATAHAAALLEAAQDAPTRTAAAERLLGIEPAAEHAWQVLIRAAAARGDRLSALAAYDSCRASLAERLRVAPSSDTEAMVSALRAAGPASTANAAPPPRPPDRGTRGARLGVLPLRLLGEGVSDHLSTGLAEEITAALARFRWLCVVDSVSLAVAAARRDEAAAAAEHRLDFMLSGTVQPGAGRVRVTLRLSQLGPTPAVVWSQRFERDAGDLLAMQDEIAAEVVARVDPEILLIEAGRAAARGTLDASAYDLLLRAIPAIHRLDREGFLAAGDWLHQAIAAEPDYAPAHAWAAYWHLFLVGQGWGGDGTDVDAERLASRAISLDPLDAQALTILGHVRAFLHHRVEEGAALHQRALTLNPNLAMAWVFSGMALSYLGAHEAALARLDRYKQLAPCHPHAFFFDAGRGIPLLCLGRHTEAAAVGRDATALQPGFSYPYKTYLAALGHLGLRTEAQAVCARLLAIEPDFDIAKALRRTPLRREEDRAHYERGLRLAGLN